MNPRNKATSAKQNVPPHKSQTVQPKVNARRPTAPPVYRPQQGHAAVQPKLGQKRSLPAAPPVYRPQPVPKVLQAKMPAHQSKGAPVAPPVYRPQPVPHVLQRKQAGGHQPSPNQLRCQPSAPPASCAQQAKSVQLKPAVVAQARKPPKAPAVYQPHQQRTAQPKVSTTVQRHIAPFSPRSGLGGVIQCVTEPPGSIVVHIEAGTKRIVAVQNDTGGNIPFAVLGEHSGQYNEGTAVVTKSGSSVSSVRFARVDTKEDDLMSMPKVKFAMREVAATPIIVEPIEPPTANFTFAISRQGGLVREKFTGFENTHKGDQGTVHFEKHGAERGIEATSKLDYINKAKAYGAEGGRAFCEAIVKNTLIRVDPEGTEIRKVLIANGKTIRTFYVWDPLFSSDPFAFAIYYTITSNLKIPLAKVDPVILQQLEEAGVNLEATERELIIDKLEKGDSIEDIHSETLAPIGLITVLRNEIRS
jgi:hypothetical protein